MAVTNGGLKCYYLDFKAHIFNKWLYSAHVKCIQPSCVEWWHEKQ